MSTAKVRARRRRRARHAWEKTTGHVYYYDPLTNLERQAEGADYIWGELTKLITDRYPGAMQIHDCFMIDVRASEADGVKARMSEVLRNWHKTAGFGLSFDRGSPKNFRPVDFGDPVNLDATNEHPKAP